MATIAVQITEAGPVAPSYADILQQLKNLYWSIYGSDANLDSDTQDGQWVAVQAQAIYDCNQAVVAEYNSRSPSTAQGAALSSVVKINGIARQVATNSQALVRIVGQVGTTINGGIVGDNLNLQTQWNLPDAVVIPDAGQIDVTATCSEVGRVSAEAGTLTVILTPTRGWQTVTNAAAATMGSPVESDATLRQRQAVSTSLPAESVIEAIYGALAAVSGVSRLQVYENDTDTTDADGIPSHSISAVLLGGDAMEIAETIAGQKTPGTGTYGDVSELVIDERGVPSTIRFFVLDQIRITVEVDVDALPGYTSAIGEEIKAAVSAYLTGMSIGEDSYLSRLFGAAGLGGTGNGATFVVTAIRQGINMDPPAAANIVFAFNEAGFADAVDVTVTPT